MKSVLQIIALWLFGLNPMEMIVAFGSIIIFFQLLMNKFLETWKMKSSNKKIEYNVWTIE